MIPQFTLYLILGMATLWCLLPRPLITSGFFRIQNLVVLGLSVLGGLMADNWADYLGKVPSFAREMMIALAVMAFVSSVFWTLERRQAGTALLFAVWTISLLLLLSQFRLHDSVGRQLVTIASVVAAAVSLGGGMAVMLLGHWYLTATGMSLIPLSRGVTILTIAVIVRAIVWTASVGLASIQLRPDIWQELWQTHFIWTLLRISGLIAPLVLVFLTRNTLKYRNTQSATGVLFATVILLFIGEAASLLLSPKLHWPL